MDSTVNAYKTRYEKALKVIRKYKNQHQFETEVSKELAKRNEQLIRAQETDSEKMKSLQSNLEMLANLVLQGPPEEAQMVAKSLLSSIRPTSAAAHVSSKDRSEPAPEKVPKSSAVQTSESPKTTALPNLSGRNRRQSAVCIALPEISGTSLTRKASEVDHERRTSMEPEDGNSNIPEHINNLASDTIDEDCAPSVAVSDADRIAPLFEHFIVVGAPSECGVDLANKIRQHDDKSYSSFLMKRLGGIMMGSGSGGSSKQSVVSHSHGAIPRSSSTVSNHSSVATDDTRSVESVNSDGGSGSSKEPAVAPTSNLFPPSTGTAAASSSSFSILRGVSSASMFSRFTPFTTSANSAVRENRASSVASDTTVASTASGDPFPLIDVDCGANAASTTATAGNSAPTAAGSSQSSPNPAVVAAPSLSSDPYDSSAITDANILFRYPQLVEPPPPEVCDFCLPLGGKLQRIHGKDQTTTLQDILYSHHHSKRSGKCFLFMLEDKTLVGSGPGSLGCEESGVGTGRLYGICVIHPRVMRSVVDQTPATQGESAQVLTKVSYDFESSVCYAFITRFPLFEFFFQVLFDMITAERLQRMEQLADSSDSSESTSSTVLGLDNYEYLPNAILTAILDRLSKLQPPKYEESLRFNSVATMAPIICSRTQPQGECILEHMVASSAWALPTLLSWLSVETLVWTIGFLMCEGKLIVVGTEPGLVSCGVMGLLSLLRPMLWLAPLIPMLPLKHIDFVESPVPILAGLVHEPTDPSRPKCSAAELLKRCNDAANGTISAVLDLNERELYISGVNADIQSELLLPGAASLASRLKECLTSMEQPSPSLNAHAPPSPSGKAAMRNRPLYAVSQLQRDEGRAAQELIERHIVTLTKLGKKVIEKARRDRLNKIAKRLPGCKSESSDKLSSQGSAVLASEHVFGFEDLPACEEEVDAYQDLESEAPVTIDEDASPGLTSRSNEEASLRSESARQQTAPATDSASVSPASSARQQTPTAPIISTSSKLSSSSSTWLSSFASKTWGSATTTTVATTTPSQPAHASQAPNLSPVFSDDEEEEESSDKEELRELGDYYSSFLQRRNSNDGEAGAGQSPPRRLSQGGGQEPNVSSDVPENTAQSQQAQQSQSKRRFPAALSLSNMQANPVTSPAAATTPNMTPITPNRPNTVGGFFSGLLGSGLPANANGSLENSASGLFTDRSVKPVDAVIALSKEPLESDEDSFMRRFVITQMFSEMFGYAPSEADPNSFDEDNEEADDDEESVYLSQWQSSPRHSDKLAPIAQDSQAAQSSDVAAAVESNVDAAVTPGGPMPPRRRNSSGGSATAQISSFIGSVSKAASKSLNINASLRSLSIQTSSGLGLAVDNLGQRLPHSMKTVSPTSSVKLPKRRSSSVGSASGGGGDSSSKDTSPSQKEKESVATAAADESTTSLPPAEATPAAEDLVPHPHQDTSHDDPSTEMLLL